MIDLKDYGYDEDNYGVRISINEKYGFLVYGYGKNGDGYIGFAFDTSSLSTNEKRLLIRIFKRFGKDNQGEEDLYPCWCWVDSTLLNEYVSFVRFIKKQVASENLPISFESICPKHR